MPNPIVQDEQKVQSPADLPARKAVEQTQTELGLLISLSSDTIYRMSADWGEMRNLKGFEFLADS